MEQENDPLLVLLERIKVGEEDALEALYNTTVNRVFGLAIKIVGRPELAEEVVSDVFLQVWRKAHSFDAERAVPLAWLLMICRSRSLDRLRREKVSTRNQYQEDEQRQVEDTGTATPHHNLSQNEFCGHVREALEILNQKQRQVISLAFYQGMSHQEISEYTGDPLGTVKSNIRRGQEILKKALSRHDLGRGDIYGEA